jgi:hypothetical protein
MNTTENNKLIAEFMGVETTSDATNSMYHYEGNSIGRNLHYHNSWDWLMPVVEKIESDERYDVDILQYGTRIRENQKNIVSNIADISFDKKIEHTYDAVVEFINQLNNNNYES